MMTHTLLSQIVEQLKKRGVVFDKGLSNEEIRQIEQDNQFDFPPDLESFLQYALPVALETEYDTNFDKFPNWRTNSVTIMTQAQKGLLEGFIWQLEHDDEFWLNRWGERPSNLTEAASIVQKDFANAPILVPIYSHRFIPSKPRAIGNPIFSVVGVDIVRYGNNLWQYLAKEFQFQMPQLTASKLQAVEFWDDFLSQNR